MLRTAGVSLVLLLVACVPAQESPRNGVSVPASAGSSASAMSAPTGPSVSAGSSTPAMSPGPSRHRPKVPAVDDPDPALTPGATFAVGVTRICSPGYASDARDVSASDKAAVYARYSIPWVPYQHEVDHLISLELGGSNALRNLWPEPYAGRWGARTKDVLENRLHALVCGGELSLSAAQRQEATDWVSAYLRYVGRPPTRGDTGGSTSAGGYYASSYPTASTIYCADDPAWHTLSQTYRVHVATFAEALARFPGYHLHQPC